MVDTRPEAKAAHRKLRTALVAGLLTRPAQCQECGKEPPPGRDGRTRIQGHHHKGYDRPLDVVWLCTWCHAKHTPQQFGIQNPNARITDVQVADIRASTDGPRAIAKKYGLSRGYVQQIRRGEWRRSSSDQRTIT